MTVNFATTGVDTIDQGDGADTLSFTAANQTQNGDVFDGGTGTDTIVVGTGLTVFGFQALPTGGFFGYEGLTFSGAGDARFVGIQFGNGLISNSLHLTGSNGTFQQVLIIDAENFSAAHWTFTDWETNDFIAIDGNGSGNVLTGGRGRDALSGGPDNDTFQFVHTTDSLKGNPDVIEDFSHAEGDRIDLH